MFRSNIDQGTNVVPNTFITRVTKVGTIRLSLFALRHLLMFPGSLTEVKLTTISDFHLIALHDG